VTSYELPLLCYIRRPGNHSGDYLYYWTSGEVRPRYRKEDQQTSIAIDFAGRIESSVTEAEFTVISRLQRLAG
jgi:hypothetical protein